MIVGALMKNLCLDKRVVHPLATHKMNHNECEGVGLMIEGKVELIIGKTKLCIVPPSPVPKEEFKRRLDEVKTAGWAIIKEMLEKK